MNSSVIVRFLRRYIATSCQAARRWGALSRQRLDFQARLKSFYLPIRTCNKRIWFNPFSITCMGRIKNEKVLKKMQTKRPYAQNRKEAVEIPGTYNEKGWLGEFATHRVYREQQSQGEGNLLDKFVRRGGWIGWTK